MKFERTNLVGGSIRELRLPTSVEIPTQQDTLILRQGVIQRTLDAGQVRSTPVRVLGLYPFSSHMFTNAEATGRFGPSASQCLSAYSETAWASDPQLFTVSNGIQIWTVPASGVYRIEARGAQGGDDKGNIQSRHGGKGASIEGEFLLSQGDKMKILVGQRGDDANTSFSHSAAGGGGGTFVALLDNTPLIVAGGGSGATTNGMDGVGGRTQLSGGASQGVGNTGRSSSGPVGMAGNKNTQFSQQADPAAGFSGQTDHLSASLMGVSEVLKETVILLMEGSEAGLEVPYGKAEPEADIAAGPHCHPTPLLQTTELEAEVEVITPGTIR